MDITDIILTVSITVTLIIGLRQQRNNSRVTARRATLDFIFSHEIHNDQWLKELTACHKVLTADIDRWKALVQPKNDDDRETIQKLYNVLNHFEMIAIGIAEGSVDENTYKKWARGVVIAIWQKGRQFIVLARENEPTNTKFCIELEALADKWINESQLGK